MADLTCGLILAILLTSSLLFGQGTYTRSIIQKQLILSRRAPTMLAEMM